MDENDSSVGTTRLPPLTALRAFEAAARHLSFQRAAAELGVTASALSHQIRGLEEFLQEPLFHRQVRAVSLTEAGAQLFPDLRDGFAALEAGLRRFRARRGRTTLVITAAPSIAARWVMPRLYRFEAEHPTIDIRLSATTRQIDLTREDVDLALRHGAGIYPGLVATRLFGEAYAPMCVPSLAEGLTTPADLLRRRLLFNRPEGSVTHFHWDEWFASVGVDLPEPVPEIGFDQWDYAHQAALDGAGVLLGRIAVGATDLMAGRLVMPFPHRLPSERAYFAVTAPARTAQPAVQAVIAWLRAEAAATGIVPP